MKIFGGYIYILTNLTNNVLYVGVTEDLIKRIYQHKQKLIEGFSKKYNVTKLVYFERFKTIFDAIAREKQIKAGSRKKKIALVNSLNPDWKDLYSSIL